jgi:hypothetical protein
MPIPFHQQVRLAIYDHFLRTGHAPTPTDIALASGASEADARGAFETLRDKHLIYLDPESGRVQMAWPLSGVETAYGVQVHGVRLYANCAWDLFGIPAMLGIDVALEAPCAHTGEPLSMTIEDQQVRSAQGVVHFLVPPRRWYDDIVHT